jgi:thiamine-phosphate diphosphorylase
VNNFDTAALSVYLVTDAEQCQAAGRSVVETVAGAVKAGVRAVQVRAKDANTASFLAEVLELGEALIDLDPTGEVLLFINDRVDVALAARQAGVRVAGVHLGHTDLPPNIARKLLWSGALIGVSVNNAGQLQAAEGVADYFGIGPLYPTPTKVDAEPALGLSGCAALAASTSVPAVTIGGVKTADLPRIRRAGLQGGAVVSAICAAANPAAASAALVASWQGAIR